MGRRSARLIVFILAMDQAVKQGQHQQGELLRDRAASRADRPCRLQIDVIQQDIRKRPLWCTVHRGVNAAGLLHQAGCDVRRQVAL